MLPRERITRALGHLTEARVPRALLTPVLGVYTRAYNVDMSEAIVPDEGFGSFNEFFTRKLRDGLRPLDPDPGMLISPADGRLDDGGPVDPLRTFVVKGQRYAAAELLGSTDDAARFAGGTYAIVYLSPRDYHRVHSPIDAEITHVRHIPGTLFPVNEFGVKHVPHLLARNERVVIMLRSPTVGRIAMVMVGAMIVGKISLTFEGPARPPFGGTVVERWYDATSMPRVAKGDEVGAFLLGSTVVMLMERSGEAAYHLEPGVVGTHVRFGQAIARRSNG
jgi:phosphatidylserine decarboxylase